MADSTLWDILAAVKTTLQTIDGGTPTFGGDDFRQDLSGTDRVKFGQPLPAERNLPVVYIGGYVDPVEHGETLGAYHHFQEIPIVGLVGASSDSVEERLRAATNLHDDIIRVFFNDRNLKLGGPTKLVRDIIPTDATITDSAAPGAAGPAVVELGLRIDFVRKAP